MKLSIIIPVYNEAAHINELLFYLHKHFRYSKDCEIIAVDGGSTDGTQGLLKQEKVKLITSQKGRGIQMNTGAKVAKGEILYFLHADSFPPKHFDDFIFKEIEKGNQAGCFKMKFRSSHWWLSLASWFTQFNVKFFRGGDQSLFITKKWFSELGGFHEEAPIFEDVCFIRKLYREKHFTVIQKWISTSARRYEENGIARLQYHFWMLYVKNWLGASPDQLLEYYRVNIR